MRRRFYDEKKAQRRRRLRRLRRGWRYRIPADVFTRKQQPFYFVPELTRRHPERIY